MLIIILVAQVYSVPRLGWRDNETDGPRYACWRRLRLGTSAVLIPSYLVRINGILYILDRRSANCAPYKSALSHVLICWFVPPRTTCYHANKFGSKKIPKIFEIDLCWKTLHAGKKEKAAWRNYELVDRKYSDFEGKSGCKGYELRHSLRLLENFTYEYTVCSIIRENYQGTFVIRRYEGTKVINKGFFSPAKFLKTNTDFSNACMITGQKLVGNRFLT